MLESDLNCQGPATWISRCHLLDKRCMHTINLPGFLSSPALALDPIRKNYAPVIVGALEGVADPYGRRRRQAEFPRRAPDTKDPGLTRALL
jgi:hypothetical protein